MLNNLDLAAIANTNVPVVTDGDAFNLLSGLISGLWPLINEINHAQRPDKEDEWGMKDGKWQQVAHVRKPLTSNEICLIQRFEQARAGLIVAAIKDPRYQHSRTRGDHNPHTYIYHRDRTSPSGVMCAASGPAEIVDPLIREHHNNSPLSPTEGLTRVGGR